MRERLEINVERVKHNGHLVLTTIHGGQYLKYVYIGYTQREARQLFRKYVAEELSRTK